MWKSSSIRSNIRENDLLRYNLCTLGRSGNLQFGIEHKEHNSDGAWIFALCDGNGDNERSKLYCEHLPETIIKSEDFTDGNFSTAIENGFSSMDKDIKEKDDLGIHNLGIPDGACLVLISKADLIVANSGYSRCIISRLGQLEVLSAEHKDSNISKHSGSSTLEQENIQSGSRLMVCKPEQKKIPLSEDVDFIILGSECLWTLLSNERVFSTVHKYIKQENGIARACDEIFTRFLEAADARSLEVAEDAEDARELLEVDTLVMLVELKKSPSSIEAGGTTRTLSKQPVSIVPRYIAVEVEQAIQRKDLDLKYVICRPMDKNDMLRKLAEVTLLDYPANPSYNLTPDGEVFYDDDLRQLCMIRGAPYSARTEGRAEKINVVAEAYKELAEHDGVMNIRTFRYSFPELFPGPKSIEPIIKMACIMLGCTRSSLRAYATSTGFVSGQVKLVVTTPGQPYEQDCEFGLGGQAVPMEVEDVSDIIIKPNAKKIRCILVVEKHTVFVNLNKAGIQKRIGCVLVTGCGQASEATRILVPKLAYKLNVLVYCLVDSNPSG